jgi:hypothetical protein
LPPRKWLNHAVCAGTTASALTTPYAGAQDATIDQLVTPKVDIGPWPLEYVAVLGGSCGQLLVNWPRQTGAKHGESPGARSGMVELGA